VVEGGRSRRGRQWQSYFNAPFMRGENGEGEVMGCDRFHKRIEGGGEATPQCRRWTTQRRAT
jgi:hypothetical protein